jgi:hypothetical protein
MSFFFDFLAKEAVLVLIMQYPNEFEAQIWLPITWLLDDFRVLHTDAITCLYMPPTFNRQFPVHF